MDAIRPSKPLIWDRYPGGAPKKNKEEIMKKKIEIETDLGGINIDTGNTKVDILIFLVAAVLIGAVIYGALFYVKEPKTETKIYTTPWKPSIKIISQPVEGNISSQ